DGNPHKVSGDLKTIMAGLSCGEPNPIAWPILRDYADIYTSCPDCVAEKGMKTFANPVKGDNAIVSGESGAVGLGLLLSVVERGENEELRRKLRLTKDSRILLFNTEGDTDPVGYHRIVDGENSFL
ncbi:MAG: diaminopropionate ammonia-lyase, partial [Candidatus Methanofastidiosia archaeon]